MGRGTSLGQVGHSIPGGRHDLYREGGGRQGGRRREGRREGEGGREGEEREGGRERQRVKNELLNGQLVKQQYIRFPSYI